MSFLSLLRQLHPYEWCNFLERQGQPPALSGENLEIEMARDAHLAQQVRLWASMRGQTLLRTVVGMQHYHTALAFLAQLEGEDAGGGEGGGEAMG